MSARSSGFGTVDKLPSGKWRARYTGPDARRRSKTFLTKSDARAWLATAQADVVRRAWRAPEAGRKTVGEYAVDFIARDELRESTRALYAQTWRLHLAPRWADVPVGDVTPAAVRAWHGKAAKSTGPTALSQAYRVLRAIFGVVVADEVLPANPCRLKSAGTPKVAKTARALTVDEVHGIADAILPRYSALILVLAFGGLRYGEATALRRQDVSDDRSKLRVERSVAYVKGSWLVGPPKTEAGVRTVALPASVADALAEHMRAFVPPGVESLLFGTAAGTYLSSSNFARTFRLAVERCGLPPTRVHWLRHTGATLAAGTGATTKELMARLGHASPAAALVYQHAASERDDAIARALDGLIRGR